MTYKNIMSLSHAEATFLTELAAKGKEIFTTREAYRILGPGKPTRGTLERLVDKGWLERIERGKYLIVPLEAGPDRVWTEDALVLASHLVKPSMVAYWSALSHWNLTDQVPPGALMSKHRSGKRTVPQWCWACGSGLSG